MLNLVPLWRWDPNLPTSSSERPGTEMPMTAEWPRVQGCTVPLGLALRFPLPAANLGPKWGPHPHSQAGGCWGGGADMLAAPQHMYPSVSPSVGVYRALTQDMCDGRTVARLREGSNRTGVVSAD